MSNPTPATPPPTAAPASRWRKLGKRLGVLLLATLFAGLLAEGLVLLILGEQVKFPRHVVAAPFGLRINQPNAVYRHKSPDVEVWFHINSQGMRAERDYPKQKPAGVKRILSLGDSFTIGYEVDVEDCFSSVLERELRAKGYEVEVLNAGVSGYSTAEECLYLERELLQYDPDLVLVSFYTNDLNDNLRSELFRLEGDVLVPGRPEYVPLGGLGTFLNTNPVLSFLSSYSNAFALLKESFTREYKRERQAELRKEVGAELTEEHERPKAPPAKTPESPAGAAPPAPTQTSEPAAPPATEPQPQTQPTAEEPAPKDTQAVQPPARIPAIVGELALYSKRLTSAILQRMFDDCRSRGIAFVLQVIPHFGDDDQGGETLLTRFPYSTFDTAQPGLGFLDGRTLLEPYVGKEQLYWLRSHRHWTPYSHEISGKALAEYIDSQGLLKR